MAVGRRDFLQSSTIAMAGAASRNSWWLYAREGLWTLRLEMKNMGPPPQEQLPQWAQQLLAEHGEPPYAAIRRDRVLVNGKLSCWALHAEEGLCPKALPPTEPAALSAFCRACRDSLGSVNPRLPPAFPVQAIPTLQQQYSMPLHNCPVSPFTAASWHLCGYTERQLPLLKHPGPSHITAHNPQDHPPAAMRASCALESDCCNFSTATYTATGKRNTRPSTKVGSGSARREVLNGELIMHFIHYHSETAWGKRRFAGSALSLQSKARTHPRKNQGLVPLVGIGFPAISLWAKLSHLKAQNLHFNSDSSDRGTATAAAL